jgi:hypothetical protein
MESSVPSSGKKVAVAAWRYRFRGVVVFLVMDILNLMVTKAADEGLLQPLSSWSIQHRVSLYADDVVMFLRPAVVDVDLTMGILHLFGEASVLKTNIQKSSVAPIHCSSTYLEVI